MTPNFAFVVQTVKSGGWPRAASPVTDRTDSPMSVSGSTGTSPKTSTARSLTLRRSGGWPSRPRQRKSASGIGTFQWSILLFAKGALDLWLLARSGDHL